ncbi:MAG: histidine phosphatase family protein [Microgenomates group bacterium]
MAKIYLVRHGESLANTLGIYQGQTYDTDLSPLGYRQVLALHDYFLGIKVEAIYASPLTRTQKTAESVGRATNRLVALDPQLLETNHGQWEGLPKTIIQERWGELLARWSTNPTGVSFPGGETYEMLQARVTAWFEKIKHNPKDTVYVTHDNVIRVVAANLLGLREDRFWDFPLDPAGVTIINVQNGVARILKLNENTHLSECLTNLSTHAL